MLVLHPRTGDCGWRRREESNLRALSGRPQLSRPVPYPSATPPRRKMEESNPRPCGRLRFSRPAGHHRPASSLAPPQGFEPQLPGSEPGVLPVRPQGISLPGRTRTCNPLLRRQMRYPVAPRRDERGIGDSNPYLQGGSLTCWPLNTNAPWSGRVDSNHHGRVLQTRRHSLRSTGYARPRGLEPPPSALTERRSGH